MGEGRERLNQMDQMVARVGLGKVVSYLVDLAEQRGSEPGAVVGALVDVLVAYAWHHRLDVERDIVEPAREFAARLKAENT